MVQINLLPTAEIVRRQKRLELQIKLGPVIFVLIAVMLAVIVGWAILGMRLTAEQEKVSQVDGQLESLKFSLQNRDKLNADKNNLQGKLEFLNRNLKRDILWARTLNDLSNLVPEGIWLKSLVLYTKKEDNFEKYEKLDIKGSAIALENKQTIDAIGEFMSALNQNQMFAKQFSDIKLVSSQRSRSGEIEVMDFELLCQFR